MTIAICDDNINDVLKIEELLLKYKTRYSDRNFKLEEFSDPSGLYHKILEGEFADISILDMLMPGRTGIDLGSQIRKSGCESGIIYITSSDDYALDAYGVHAVRYLLKPIDEEKLFEALDYSLSYYDLRRKRNPVCLFKTKDGLVQMSYSQIEYIESANRKLEVHLVSGEILKSLFIRKSFEEEIQEIAEKNNFQQVHKSFLVNFDYVKQLSVNSMIMESGRQIPVSKAKAARVKREYLLYVSGKYK